jgi:hypothetical protein
LLHKHNPPRADELRQRADRQHRRRALPERWSSTPRNATMTPQNVSKTTQPHHHGGCTSVQVIGHPRAHCRDAKSTHRTEAPDQTARLRIQSPNDRRRHTGTADGQGEEGGDHRAARPHTSSTVCRAVTARPFARPAGAHPTRCRNHAQPRAQPHTLPGRLPH